MEDIIPIPRSIPRLNVIPFSPFSAAFAILEIVLGPGVMAIVRRYINNSNTLVYGDSSASNSLCSV